MECSICNENYDFESEHKPFSLNPCGHCFCLKCIKALTQKNCPVCRTYVMSEIPNYAIFDVIKESSTANFKLSSQIPLASNRETKIFKYTLNEMNELKQSLVDAFKKKQIECQNLIEEMKRKIQKETESKITQILSDSQKLMSHLDFIYFNVDEKLYDMSQIERIKIDLERLEKDLNNLSLSELSKNENNLRCDVMQRKNDLENFKLNFFICFKKIYEGKNQIGKLFDQESKNTNQTKFKMKDLTLENSLSQAGENLVRVVPSAPLNDEFD
jgi:hypothetical protein